MSNTNLSTKNPQFGEKGRGSLRVEEAWESRKFKRRGGLRKEDDWGARKFESRGSLRREECLPPVDGLQTVNGGQTLAGIKHPREPNIGGEYERYPNECCGPSACAHDDVFSKPRSNCNQRTDVCSPGYHGLNTPKNVGAHACNHVASQRELFQRESLKHRLWQRLKLVGIQVQLLQIRESRKGRTGQSIVCNLVPAQVEHLQRVHAGEDTVCKPCNALVSEVEHRDVRTVSGAGQNAACQLEGAVGTGCGYRHGRVTACLHDAHQQCPAQDSHDHVPAHDAACSSCTTRHTYTHTTTHTCTHTQIDVCILLRDRDCWCVTAGTETVTAVCSTDYTCISARGTALRVHENDKGEPISCSS